MIANRLAKYIDGRLSPDHRFSLFTAAYARGDEAEANRVVRESPQMHWAVPDFFPQAVAMHSLYLFHFICVLDMVLAADVADGLAHNDQCSAERRSQMARVAKSFRRLLRIETKAWRLFCRELGLDGWQLWRDLPGFDRLQQHLEWAKAESFTAADDAALYREIRPDGEDVTQKTVKSCVRALRKAHADMMATWK